MKELSCNFIKFHLCFLLVVQLINHRWFGLFALLKQWWSISLTRVCVTRPRCVKIMFCPGHQTLTCRRRGYKYENFIHSCTDNIHDWEKERWLAGEVVDHIGSDGSKAGDGFSAFNVGVAYSWYSRCWCVELVYSDDWSVHKLQLRQQHTIGSKSCCLV